MINFFRRIRQKLFIEKSFNRYFLYAIGEMILVVLGILIALQINNWNENRKSKALSEEMIAEIKSGIEGDLKELEQFIYSQKTVWKSQTIVSEWLNGNTIYNDSLAQHFSKTCMSMDYSINYAGYETLKKFGLRRVEDDSLRISIADLYEKKYPTITKFIEIYQKFLEDLLSKNSKHFKELNYLNANMKPIDSSKLKADNEYTYRLNTLKNFSQLLIFQCSILKKEMKKTYAKF